MTGAMAICAGRAEPGGGGLATEAVGVSLDELNKRRSRFAAR